MKEALTYIINSLVDKPGDFTLDSSEKDNNIRFKVSLSDSDRGRIIGKEGRVVKSIRNFLQVAAQKTGSKVFIDIV